MKSIERQLETNFTDDSIPTCSGDSEKESKAAWRLAVHGLIVTGRLVQIIGSLAGSSAERGGECVGNPADH
jgi:hypothetical protein